MKLITIHLMSDKVHAEDAKIIPSIINIISRLSKDPECGKCIFKINSWYKNKIYMVRTEDHQDFQNGRFLAYYIRDIIATLRRIPLSYVTLFS